MVPFPTLIVLLLGLFKTCHTKQVLDFSDDNDRRPDKEIAYTHASLRKGNLPRSFTICAAFMVEAWTEETYSYVFSLMRGKDNTWLALSIWSKESETVLKIELSEDISEETLSSFFFPLTWMNLCLLVDSETSTVTLFVDSEEVVKKEMDVKDIPANMHLIFGWDGRSEESTGRVTQVNIFSAAVTSTRMKTMTKAGEASCGEPGDFFSWEDSAEDFVLHSNATMVEVEKGSCQRQSKMQVYLIEDWHGHSDCMDLCQNLGGRSPSVRTLLDWQTLRRELHGLL